MTHVNEAQVRDLVSQVVQRLQADGSLPRPAGTSGAAGVVQATAKAQENLFGEVECAVRATRQAQAEWAKAGLEDRHRVVAAIRAVGHRHAEALSKRAVEETGLGRFDDKLEKLRLVLDKTPGPEDLDSRRRVWSGDHGLVLIELAPYGVIGAITPTTNPADTVFNNAISFVSAGNGAIFNAHPTAREVSNWAARLINQAIIEAGGPAHLITAVATPTIETANQLMTARGVDLLVVTGGPHVVKAALQSRKKVIAGGPGNPPVVVDETADLERAARAIYKGASFDNNVICTLEKECVVVAAVADKLKDELKRCGAYEVPPHLHDKLFAHIFSQDHGPGKEAVVNKQCVGKNASEILAAIGVTVDPERCRLAIVEVNRNHPLLWTEQLMPVFPITRVRDVDEAIDLAIELEGGRGHTACMHSRNIDALSKMARLINTAIFVKNGPSLAGLGAGSDAPTAWTIAGPTGEGCTSARHFTKERRCVLTDAFRIV
ncbi:MAG: aldehyde dehydrogenase family protein [Candidatus Sericytochromatia bacterium]|nr:aldehyde dehydrogenase family protein [Candidatus Sericytochromatia bacterium]